MNHVTVIGAGLAGSECAWQLAQRGISVTLREMKPEKLTPAHQTADFAELCCSNSLRAAGLENAVGLLKEELRQLGMSLDDIAEYFNDRNLEKSTRILKEQHELLKKEIKEKTALEKMLRRKLSFINKINSIQKVGVPTFKELPQRFMITHGKLYKDGRQIVTGQTELEKYLSVKAPVLATDRMAYYTTENIFAVPYNRDFGLAPMIFCNPEEINKSIEINLIPSGRYACIYYNGFIRPDNDNFEKLKKFISDNGCTVSGNIYIQHIIDVTLTSRPSEKMIEMQVPVE